MYPFYPPTLKHLGKKESTHLQDNHCMHKKKQNTQVRRLSSMRNTRMYHHKGRDFCLCCFLLSLQHLEPYTAQSSCSLNTYWMNYSLKKLFWLTKTKLLSMLMVFLRLRRILFFYIFSNYTYGRIPQNKRMFILRNITV